MKMAPNIFCIFFSLVLAVSFADDMNPACPNILVSVFSNSSNQWTMKLANEVVNGAINASANVRLKRVNETTCDDMLWSDGIALGSPVYWATMSSATKSFLENLQTNCFGWPITQMTNKVGTAFTTGGHISDGKDATMSSIIAVWSAMSMVTIGCDCNNDCTCNPWGASATRADDSIANELTSDEILGGQTLGMRLAEVAGIMSGKNIYGECASSSQTKHHHTSSAEANVILHV